MSQTKANINEIDIRARSGVVQEVDMRRINSKPMIDMGLALQGSVPGLIIQNTGELGSTPEIRIRGNSSLRKGIQRMNRCILWTVRSSVRKLSTI